MRKIKLCKGGDTMITLTRNSTVVTKQVEGELTDEQLQQLRPILDKIRYRREMGIEKCYTLEQVMEELTKEDESNRKI